VLPKELYQWASVAAISRTSVAAISRKYLAIRYSLLPYYYTLFFMANHDPSTLYIDSSYSAILRPLFFDFNDAVSVNTDDKFLLGGGILVAPQVNLGK